MSELGDGVSVFSGMLNPEKSEAVRSFAGEISTFEKLQLLGVLEREC